MYCSKCGSPNNEAARFCEKCGTALAAAPPQGPPPPQWQTQATPPPPQWQTQTPPPPQWQAPPPQWDPRMRGGAAQPMPGQPYSTGKSPVVAVLLSAFIPGVGQFYCGDAKKGGLMLGGYVLSWILAAVYIGVIGIFGIWIWSMIDAYNLASGKTAISR